MKHQMASLPFRKLSKVCAYLLEREKPSAISNCRHLTGHTIYVVGWRRRDDAWWKDKECMQICELSLEKNRGVILGYLPFAEMQIKCKKNVIFLNELHFIFMFPLVPSNFALNAQAETKKLLQFVSNRSRFLLHRSSIFQPLRPNEKEHLFPFAFMLATRQDSCPRRRREYPLIKLPPSWHIWAERGEKKGE